MSGKVEELESKLRDLLPKSPTVEVDSAIPELTRELIREGNDAWRTINYTHSVCHLFEQYGKDESYLNSTTLLPVAGELVDYTLRKTMEARDFGCVGRIVRPIMDLNLAHLEENPEGFTFRPEILTDPDFIQGFSSSRETEYAPHLVDFCKSASIGEFFPKYVESLRKEEELGPVLNANEVVPGIFIDVEGTLVEYDRDDDFYKRLASTQEYALRKMDEGIPVTIFTGAHLEDAVEELKSAGVDERLCDVKPKGEFIGRILETCVDDTAPTMQGFRARTHYESGKKAWDTEYSADR
jgi:hypothetical protein